MSLYEVFNVVLLLLFVVALIALFGNWCWGLKLLKTVISVGRSQSRIYYIYLVKLFVKSQTIRIFLYFNDFLKISVVCYTWLAVLYGYLKIRCTEPF